MKIKQYLIITISVLFVAASWRFYPAIAEKVNEMRIDNIRDEQSDLHISNEEIKFDKAVLESNIAELQALVDRKNTKYDENKTKWIELEQEKNKLLGK